MKQELLALLLALLLDGGLPFFALDVFSILSFKYLALCGRLASSSPEILSTFLLWNFGEGDDILALLCSMFSSLKVYIVNAFTFIYCVLAIYPLLILTFEEAKQM